MAKLSRPLTSDTFNLIRDAILNKQQVTAMYLGRAREMCPHIIGWKNGREKALFCQFGGRSNSAGIITPNSRKWRCLFIDDLSEVVARIGLWYTLDTTSEHQTCIDVVDLAFIQSA